MRHDDGDDSVIEEILLATTHPQHLTTHGLLCSGTQLTKPPAPPVEPRVVPKPGTRSTGPGPNASPLAALANLFSGHQ